MTPALDRNVCDHASRSTIFILGGYIAVLGIVVEGRRSARSRTERVPTNPALRQYLIERNVHKLLTTPEPSAECKE